MIGSLLRALFVTRPRPASGGGDAVVFVSNIGRSMRVEANTPLESPSASSRLRVLAPIRALLPDVPVWVVAPEDLIRDPALDGFCRPRALVVTKFATQDLLRHRDRSARVLDALARWQGRVPLLADFSDDYAAVREGAGEAVLADYQAGLLEQCAVTVPCEALRAALAPGARHGIRVIEDPWERAQPALPRVAPGAPLRLCWFGVLNDAALAVLEPALAGILRRFPARALSIELVTAAGAGAEVDALRARLEPLHAQVRLAHQAWSREATWAALERCDFVLLPQADDDWGRVKSHNRLVETIRSGRFALASPIPSYVELQAFARVGADLAEGLDWALAHPQDAAARIGAGQQAIEARFSPAAVGARWRVALGLAIP